MAGRHTRQGARNPTGHLARTRAGTGQPQPLFSGRAYLDRTSTRPTDHVRTRPESSFTFVLAAERETTALMCGRVLASRTAQIPGEMFRVERDQLIPLSCNEIRRLYVILTGPVHTRRAKPLAGLATAPPDSRPTMPLPATTPRTSETSAATLYDEHVTVILVTGMSGTGKSTALSQLEQRGYRVVDTDFGGWIEDVHRPDGVGVEPQWREGRIDALIADHERSGEPLFIAGTVRNQGKFSTRFDEVVLLSAPLTVLLDRIAHRNNNPFGKTADERERIVADTAEIEPLLRRRPRRRSTPGSRSPTWWTDWQRLPVHRHPITDPSDQIVRSPYLSSISRFLCHSVKTSRGVERWAQATSSRRPGARAVARPSGISRGS